jgi:hypothetical protein
MDLTPGKVKRLSRGMSSEMSAEAIAKRFEVLVQLNALCDALSKAKRAGDVQGARVREEPGEGVEPGESRARARESDRGGED